MLYLNYLAYTSCLTLVKRAYMSDSLLLLLLRTGVCLLPLPTYL